ncbi:fumarylacetoacetate hydrolase family protein [Dendryphion nanum]|uniref:Fumarylacetoacetate hydrolase family protein n=1 Tax=Dendryphion nanum TaxID=256645 RepID=A0A9P9E5L8_9PLEO|nr:fumarylacetoacetate hydrolase family protein [Dendryphion nanum]
MTVDFNRLVRFKDDEGTIRYGEAPEDLDQLVGKPVSVYGGTVPWELERTGSTATIAEVLCPLPLIPIYYGIGLNYKQHIAESGFPTPQYPVVFTKPPGALAGPYQDIAIDAQCTNMDYEGELCVIIGKEIRNFKKDSMDVNEYVLGYTVGNDVSSRFWQMAPQSGNQHGYAKSFDCFGPIGPVVVSPKSPSLKERLDGNGTPDLELRTLVNGEKRQNTRTNDLLFGVSSIVEHLSRGTTLSQGTVIMTGTPSGVAAFLSPPNWLKSGDVVEVEIEQLGKIRNKMVIS